MTAPTPDLTKLRIDRDVAPPEFAEEVRLYYQRLGSGE